MTATVNSTYSLSIQDRKEIKQLTQFEDFPIINASHHGEKIIFEQAGYLHTLDPEQYITRESLLLELPPILLELRSRLCEGQE